MANYRNIVIEQTTGEVELSGSTNSSHLIFISLTSQTGGTLNVNLEACWNFEDASNTIYDSTANNHDFTTTSNLLYQRSGKINYGIGFNNRFGYMQADTGLDLTTISISFWIKFSGITNWEGGVIYNKTDLPNNKGGVGMNATIPGFINFTTNNTSGNASTITSDASLDDDTWHHIVATYNNSTQEANMYVDNVGISTNPYTMTYQPDYGAGGVPITIGNAGAPDSIRGVLDLMGVWSRVLNSTEVTYLYNSGSGRSCEQF